MYDVGIIGAGIAGSSLAISLANKGYRVCLVERSWECEDGIIGELLQPGGVQKLIELGLHEILQKVDAQPISGYAMYLNGEWLQMEYPEDDLAGYGFRYHKLISKLRELCDSHQNIECISGNVTSLVERKDQVTGFQYSTKSGNVGKAKANLTVISQGLLKSFGKNFNNSEIKVEGFMLGMILKDVDLPYNGHGHVILTDRSPILVYPVGEKQHRVLIDFDKDMPSLKGKDLEEHLLNKLCPQMPESLQKAFRKAISEKNFKTKAACNLASRPVLQNGVVMIGDNLNMRHPITGGGMTVALTDVQLLSSLLNKSEGKIFEKKVLKAFYTQRHKLNATINILADALYHVFRHNILKVACFEYLRQGGTHSSEPMEILSGISRNRWMLYRHFFAVAAYAARKMEDLGYKSRYGLTQISVMKDATSIIYPRVIAEWPKSYSYKGNKTEIRSNKDKSKEPYEYNKNRQEPQRASA